MRQNSPEQRDAQTVRSIRGDRHAIVGPALDDQTATTFRALRNLLEHITSWLVEVGSWIFGGLIAVNIVILSALITVGPVDAAIRLATAVLAVALPLNVVGIVLLRLIKDVNEVRLDDLTLRAFQDAGFPDIERYFPSAENKTALQPRRSRIGLLYSLGIAALSGALTLTGTASTLWHMGSRIALVFLAAASLSAGLLWLVMANALAPRSADGKRRDKTKRRKER